MKQFVVGLKDGLIPRPFRLADDSDNYERYWRGYVLGKKIRLKTFGRPKKRLSEPEVEE